MGRYEVYRLSRLLPILLIAGYVSVVINVKHSNGIETFPFFRWSLFSTSSEVRTRTTVQFRSINGEQLAQPRLYYGMSEIFVHARERDPNLQKAAGRLRHGLAAGQPHWVAAMRHVIEHRFMAEIETAEYDVVVLRYHPLERLRNGEIREIDVLASYRKLPGG